MSRLRSDGAWSARTSILVMGALTLALAMAVAVGANGSVGSAGTTLPSASPVILQGVPVGTPRRQRLPASVLSHTMSKERSSGNNLVAERSAARLRDRLSLFGFESWVHLDLTPSYSGTLLEGNDRTPRSVFQYVRSVQEVDLTAIFDQSTIAGTWQCMGAEDRAQLLLALLDAISAPPPSDGAAGWTTLRGLVLYQSAGVRVVIADTSGRILAFGSWRISSSGSSRELVLQLRPGAPATSVECGD